MQAIFKILIGLTAVLIIGCNQSPEITIRIGMTSKEFNSQPFAFEGFRRMDDDIGMAGTDDRVLLKLDINGRYVEFDSGGAKAFIGITYSNSPKYSGESKIDGIDFGANNIPLNYADALKLAKLKCDEIRSAGLRTIQFVGETPVKIRLDDEPFEITAHNEKMYKNAVLNELLNIVDAPVCDLEDGNLEFSMKLYNHRRDLERARMEMEPADMDTQSEKIYIVRGYVAEKTENSGGAEFRGHHRIPGTQY